MPDHLETLCTLYGQGHTWVQISTILKRSSGAAQNKLQELRRAKHPLALTAIAQRKKLLQQSKEAFGLLMAKGFSVNEIAQRMGLHKEAVRTARDRYLKPAYRSF